MNQNVAIEKSKLILAEGRDAELFLVWARDTYLDRGDVQIIDFGGINQLPPFLLNLPNMENFDKVESLVIARDAETDAKAAATLECKSDTHHTMVHGIQNMQLCFLSTA